MVTYRNKSGNIVEKMVVARKVGGEQGTLGTGTRV